MNVPLFNKMASKVEIAAKRQKLICKPVVVDVVLTKACNFACTFCKDYETEGAKRISVGNFRRMAEQLLPKASRLSICSGGEPYLHTKLEELLRIARELNPHIYTWVLSNGSILREQRLRAMMEEQLITEHGFSMDGHRAATVESIRINMKHAEVLENIRMFLRLRKEVGGGKPSVTIRYALMRTNIGELADAVAFWGDLGIDRIDAGYLSLANGMDRDLSLFYHPALTRDAFAEARAVAARYPHLTLSLPLLVEEERKFLDNPKPCHSPWRFVMIDTDGQVLPCYRAFEALRFPSVYDGASRFEDIWNSPDYQRLRETVNDDSAPKFYPYCGKCEMRYGWGDERAHLGDESWFDAVGDEWLNKDVDHRRPIKGTAAR